ncbi:hypothetical protein [Pseudomonas cucumis]|uniref:hypothetical protein n=1 Tax=Pseudomonas cucumis TaxID=2954082 RepID=UPI00273515B9|nr:hypothetical protein [Pseudomonas cucumis]WLG91590.1 hypothetical protein PSH72_05730 [Pseudomonas cucumis]
MMRQKNSTFRGAHPIWANACVGDNGSPGYVEYSKGFSKAANMLITAVLDDHSVHLTTDVFVYPICFNMRHSVELRLKGAISALQTLASLKKSKIKFDFSGSHDIYKIWNFFKTESDKLDNRFQAITNHIEPTILDIAEVDPSGQTFRYPFSTQSSKHLTEVALINFAVLYQKFRNLEAKLDELLNLYEWLQHEYNQGTFTILQRNEIFCLAIELPHRELWNNETFTTTKNQLKTKYNISSNGLSKILNLIQDHYSLAPYIGICKPLAGITTPLLLHIIDAWIESNPEIKTQHNQQTSNIVTYEELFSEMLSHSNSPWSDLERLATPELTAGLHALFYFAYDHTFTEYYESLYSRYLAEINAQANLNQDSIRHEFMHVFDKSNFLHHIIQSLYALGHHAVAEQVIVNHNLEHAFHWLSEARSGALFAPPEFAQYPENSETN